LDEVFSGLTLGQDVLIGVVLAFRVSGIEGLNSRVSLLFICPTLCVVDVLAVLLALLKC
jgi:hypothetical protein